MKSIIYLAIGVLTLASCQQSEKIGYVDNSKLINEYQEKIDVEAKLKIKIDAFQKRTDSLRQAFQLEINDAELKARKMSQADIQILSKELQDREGLLSQRVQFEQQQIALESQSKNDTLIKKVKDFVKDYGKNNGYTFIMGTSDATSSIMYGKDESDLTQTILDALNAAYKKE